MTDIYTYDAAVVVTPKDFKRVECCNGFRTVGKGGVCQRERPDSF